MDPPTFLATVGRVLLGWLLLAALFAGAWAGIGRRWRRRRRHDGQWPRPAHGDGSPAA